MRSSKKSSAVLSLLACLLASTAWGGVNDPKIPPAAADKAAPELVGQGTPVYFGSQQIYERSAPLEGAKPLEITPQEVLPEVPTRVSLSSVDVNRIVCEEGPVKDVIFSKEKGLSVSIEGSNLFVKYAVVVNPQTQEKIFAGFPTELYVVCGAGSVYTIVAVPEKVPAQTVILKSALKKIERVKELFEGIPFEKKAVSLIKWAYLEQIPEVLTVKEVNTTLELFEGIKITLRRIIDAEGEGLRLKEYIIKQTQSAPVRLAEKQFLKPEISQAPLAICLSDHELKDKPVRLFVVERRVQQ